MKSVEEQDGCFHVAFDMPHFSFPSSCSLLVSCSSVFLFLSRLQKFLGRVDADGNEQVDIREFINYVAEHEKKLWLTFKDLDKNNDGNSLIALSSFTAKYMSHSLRKCT